MSVNKPTAPSAVYLKAFPATATASIYALTTAGNDRFHIGVTNIYLSAAANSSLNSFKRATFCCSVSDNASNPLPDCNLPQPSNTSLSINGMNVS